MKNKSIIMVIAALLFIGFLINITSKVPIAIDKVDEKILLMHTDKNLITTYGMYDINLKEFNNMLVRKKQRYSDFIFDKKNNQIYYSDFADNKYNIYKANISENNTDHICLLNNDYNGDIINMANDKIYFRMLQKGTQDYTIGTIDIRNSQISLWNKQDKDSVIYNFYCNPFGNNVYTIERSLKEMMAKHFPDIPTHKIIQYNENGKIEKELYATEKYINNISVNKSGSKILFDATAANGNLMINNIYIVDIKSQDEVILIKGKDKFTTIRMPQFSSDEKGIYFLGSTSKSKIIQNVPGSNPITSNEIYYYSFATKKVSKIYGNTEAVINSFKIVP